MRCLTFFHQRIKTNDVRTDERSPVCVNESDPDQVLVFTAMKKDLGDVQVLNSGVVVTT